jgi:hypothetical protein
VKKEKGKGKFRSEARRADGFVQGAGGDKSLVVPRMPDFDA